MDAAPDRPAAFCDLDRARERRQRIREALRPCRVAVLMGGDSGEREVSLRSGKGIADALEAETSAQVIRLDVHFGRGWDCSLAQTCDLAYIALHGGYGENGTLQGYLECLGIPYTGAGVMASAAAMDKAVAGRLLSAAGIPVPRFECFDGRLQCEQVADSALAQYGLPLVTKPRSEGSSIGVRFCHTRDQVVAGVREVRDRYGAGIVSELVPEPEITCGVLHGHPLPILELVSHNEFYDYEAKYTKGLTDFILPARLPEESYLRALDIAREAAELIGCGVLARVDMRVGADGIARVLDVNTQPGMTETSDLPAEALHIGMTYSELVLEIMGSALVRAGLMSAEDWA